MLVNGIDVEYRLNPTKAITLQGRSAYIICLLLVDSYELKLLQTIETKR